MIEPGDGDKMTTTRRRERERERDRQHHRERDRKRDRKWESEGWNKTKRERGSKLTRERAWEGTRDRKREKESEGKRERAREGERQREKETERERKRNRDWKKKRGRERHLHMHNMSAQTFPIHCRWIARKRPHCCSIWHSILRLVHIWHFRKMWQELFNAKLKNAKWLKYCTIVSYYWTDFAFVGHILQDISGSWPIRSCLKLLASIFWFLGFTNISALQLKNVISAAHTHTQTNTYTHTTTTWGFLHQILLWMLSRFRSPN